MVARSQRSTSSVANAGEIYHKGGSMQLGLSGKVAIITGGSMGIGKATALALAQEGAHVAICARGLEALQKAASEIQALTGGKVLPIRADMTILEDIKRLVSTTAQELGGVDILVNN